MMDSRSWPLEWACKLAHTLFLADMVFLCWVASLPLESLVPVSPQPADAG